MRKRWYIAISFMLAILVGMVLLMLPISSPSHTWMNPWDALFTACSATCITGLTVIDVGKDLSTFGQGVMLALVQLGCLGIMTVGTFLLVVIGRRLSHNEEFTLMNAYGAKGLRGIKALVVWVVLSMLIIEGAGTYLIHQVLVQHPILEFRNLSEGELWFRAYFYSVMAFCNAGFSLDPGSIAIFASSPWVLVTMGMLVVMGGIGFLVMYNLCTIQFWRRNLLKRGRLSLHTSLVLKMTLFFLAFAFVFFLVAEWDNSLEPFAWYEKPAIAFFQAITPRTCGFTVVPLTETHPAVRFLYQVMMFIGAAPGSAGGGVKVTTFFVMLCTFAALFHGRREVITSRRTISMEVVRESLVICFMAAALIIAAMTVLLFTEASAGKIPFENLLFEAISAVTTTGLSIGNTTRDLSAAGRIVVMVCMFLGRLGALTVVTLIASKEDTLSIRYPKEEIVVG